MSEKTRKKKDGHDTNKKNQRMHEDVQERQEHPRDGGDSSATEHAHRDEKDSK